jgi:hypothetical protein
VVVDGEDLVGLKRIALLESSQSCHVGRRSKTHRAAGRSTVSFTFVMIDRMLRLSHEVMTYQRLCRSVSQGPDYGEEDEGIDARRHGRQCMGW